MLGSLGGGKKEKEKEKKSHVWLWLGDSEDRRVCGCWVTSHLQVFTPQPHPSAGFPALLAATIHRGVCFIGTSGTPEASKQCQEDKDSRNSLNSYWSFRQVLGFLFQNQLSPGRVWLVWQSSDLCASEKLQLQEWICLESSKALGEGGKGFPSSAHTLWSTILH